MDLTLDEILNVMDEASIQEKSSAYKVATIIERSSIADIFDQTKSFIEDTTYVDFKHDDNLQGKNSRCRRHFFGMSIDREYSRSEPYSGNIRNLEPQIPIVVMSVNDDAEFVASVFESGATDFLHGDDIQVVYSKLNSFLRMSKILGW